MATESAETDPWMEKTRPKQSDNPEIRRLCAVAADPNTPAAKLEAAAVAVTEGYFQSEFSEDDQIVVMETIASNPNIPSSRWVQMLWWSPRTTRAFCRNPTTSLLLQKQPNFVRDLGELIHYQLLREADAPAPFIQQLADGHIGQAESVRREARLHVAFAGQAATTKEWERQLRNYWWEACAAPTSANVSQWHADLIEIGLIPYWAMGITRPTVGSAQWAIRPLPPPESQSPERFPVLDTWFKYDFAPDTPEEAALLKQIGPKMQNQAALAHGLRKGATANDLRTLLHTLDDHFGLVWAAMLRHPAADNELLKEMVKGDRRNQQIIVHHPKAQADVLTRLLENDDPRLRRLARRHKNAPVNADAISRRTVLRFISQCYGRTPSPLISFVGALYGAYDNYELRQKADSVHWLDRLHAAFCVAVTDDPLDQAKRTGRDLLLHLSHDGNRLVRAAARTKLADPDYRFVL